MNLDDVFDLYPEIKRITEFDLLEADIFDFFKLEDKLDRLQELEFADIESMDISKSQKERLQELRDEILGIDSLTSDASIEALNDGTTTIARTVIFVSRRDDRVCSKCEDLDGDIFDVDPNTGIVDGPLIPDDLHLRCRCRYFDIGDDGNLEL